MGAMGTEQTYVWHNVLVDYTPGMAAVTAESEEGAYRKVREQRENDEIPGYVARELLATEPEPADGVEWVCGGG